MKPMKICATVLLFIPAAAFAASAFDGTWTFSADHIQLSKKPEIQLLSNGEFTCKTCRDTSTIKADGTDQALKHDPNADTIAITVVDDRTVNVVYKLGGKTVRTSKWVASADGKSFDAEETSLYGAQPTLYKERLTRVGEAPAGAHALSGTWRPSKMLSASGPGVMVTYAMTADGFMMNSNGQSYTAKFDDKTYPVTGDPTKTMVNLKKISDTEVIESDSQKDKVVEIIQMTARGPSLAPLSYLATSGGQLRDQTVHFFDLLRWISEDEPEEVYAVGAALVDPKVAEVGDVDTSLVTIRLSRGTLCQIDSSRRTGYGYDERIEVFGSKGMIESRRQRARGVSRYFGDKIIEDGLHPGWFERIEQSYYQALDVFFGAIAQGTPPSPSLEDGLKAQLLADKATESLKTGRPVKFTK